jgi:hypothetical protein
MPGLAPGVEAGPLPISTILPYLLGIPDAPAHSGVGPEAYFATDEQTYVKSPIVIEVP